MQLINDEHLKPAIMHYSWMVEVDLFQYYGIF